MKFIRISLIVTIVQVLCFCQANAENLNAVRVIVNGEIITEFDVNARIAEAFMIARQRYEGAYLEQRREEITTNAIEELINRRILVQEAKRLIILHPEKAEEVEKDLEAFVKDAVDEVGSLYRFYELANKQGVNPLTKRLELREDIMVDHLMREHVYARILITPKEIRKYYQTHTDEYSQEGELSFRQILIKFSSYESKEEAKTAVEGISLKLKEGEAFDVIAQNHSKGPHADKGGLWGFDEVRDFRKDFLKIINKLEKGEISEVTDSAIGYHIFKVEEKVGAETLSFKQVQDDIYKEIFREKFHARKKEYLDELKKNVTIERYY